MWIRVGGGGSLTTKCDKSHVFYPSLTVWELMTF